MTRRALLAFALVVGAIGVPAAVGTSEGVPEPEPQLHTATASTEPSDEVADGDVDQAVAEPVDESGDEAEIGGGDTGDGEASPDTGDGEAPPADQPSEAPAEPLEADAAAVNGNRFVAVTPTRILDTRTGLGGTTGKVGQNQTITLQVTGAAGVPAGASAVALTLTITGSEGLGYLAAWPATSPKPTASVANVEHSGQTIANLVTVPLGTNGAINLFAQPRGHLIADVAGYYLPATSATAGRFVPRAPERLYDSRWVDAGPAGRLPAGGSVTLDLAWLASVPADADAAVLNLTVTDTNGAGFFAVNPAGTAPGQTSNLNVDAAGQTIANQVVTRLSDGKLTLFSQSGAHVIVDLAGWYTGPGAASSAEGLFVPVAPSRLVDTRVPNNSPLGGAKPQPGQSVGITAAGRGGLPASGFSAIVVNATATQTSGAGFFTLWGAGLERPHASNLNATRVNQTIPNHAVVPVSTAGFSVLSQSGSHVLADVTGYFLGAPTPAPAGFSLNGPGSPPTSGAHGFLYKFSDGSHARWNPCKPITYRVNYVGAPAFARSEVAAAIAKVEAATGIPMVDMGDLTGTAGNNGTPPPGIDAVIAFVSPAEYPGISGVAGLGGGAYMPAWNGNDPRVVQGFVLINETLPYTQGLGSTGLQGLLLHELGHMMGLDHVLDYGEVMYPVMHPVPNGYGPGDRQGLWYLGAAQGCLKVAGASGFATQSNPGSGDPGAPQPLVAVRPGDEPPLLVGYCSLAGSRGPGAQATAAAATRFPGQAG